MMAFRKLELSPFHSVLSFLLQMTSGNAEVLPKILYKDQQRFYHFVDFLCFATR